MTVSAFITEVETTAVAVEQDVVAGLKAGLNYVDNVVVTDLEPELLAALKQALSLVESSYGYLEYCYGYVNHGSLRWRKQR